MYVCYLLVSQGHDRWHRPRGGAGWTRGMVTPRRNVVPRKLDLGFAGCGDARAVKSAQSDSFFPFPLLQLSSSAVRLSCVYSESHPHSSCTFTLFSWGNSICWLSSDTLLVAADQIRLTILPHGPRPCSYNRPAPPRALLGLCWLFLNGLLIAEAVR